MLTMLVNIHLKLSGTYVPFLSIPSEDIGRLSLKPLRWLLFVTFAICGAHGDLSETVDGSAVDYDTPFGDLASNYYYFDRGAFFFVDLNGLNGQITSINQTTRHADFRNHVVQRDGSCVITNAPKESCDAVHIIPQHKGNEYMDRILQYRSTLYDYTDKLELDAIENGMLLRKDIHAKYAHGQAVFLKTPNFALSPGDISWDEGMPVPPIRITLQYVEPPDNEIGSIPPHDLRFSESGHANPPAILLDYMYGIAAFRKWYSGPDALKVMQRYFEEHYKPIVPLLHPHSGTPHDETVLSDPDDPNVSEYGETQGSDSQQWSGMLQAMDELNFVLMHFSGVTPEVWAARERKREEDERNASRNKVLGWRNTLPR